MKNNRTITVQGKEIIVKTINDQDYISMTDMIKNLPNSRMVIGNWLRSKNTIQFLGIWEQMHNPNFKLIEFDEFRMNAGTGAFTLSPQQWVNSTNAIGIVSKSGRYGGTFAHKDIAFKFGAWISPEFELFLIKDYQKLKDWELSEAKREWDFRRFLSKVNYRLQTDAIEQHLIPFSSLPKDKQGIEYAKEADILNLALFGMTAKKWKQENPQAALNGGNIRDNASIVQLTILANLESLNSILIQAGLPKNDRMLRLREYAKTQLQSLLKDARMQKLSAKERERLHQTSRKNLKE